MMKPTALPLAALSLSLLSGPCLAESLFSDARHIAMGGTGVASANYYSAPLINSALLSSASMDDRFAFQASVGAEVQDQNELVDKLDRQLDSFEELRSRQGVLLDPDELQARLQQTRSNLVALDDGRGDLDANASLVIAVPTRLVNMAFVTKSRADAAVLSNVSDIDLAYLDEQLDLLQDCRNDPNQDLCSVDFVPQDLSSQVTGIAAAVSDIGLSFSLQDEWFGLPAAYGATAKLQRIDTYHYIAYANNFDQYDFDDPELINDSNHFNMDVGLTLGVTDNATFGLAVRDVIGYTVQTQTVQDLTVDYHVSPLVTSGLAYRYNWLQTAVDFDLTPHTGFTLADGTDINRGQFLRLGAELDAWGWAQLRGGYRYDVTDYANPAWTLGFGLSPWQTVRLDVAGAFSDASSVGAIAQLAITL